MSSIPLSPFSGFLKQLALDECTASQRDLFVTLFPRFSEVKPHTWSDDARRAFDHPKIVLGQPKQARRFGGYFLPRARYHSVCSDSQGHDGGTLVHELRAYRAPALTGMVEVVDLGMGPVVLASGKHVYELPRAQELAVVIHEPTRFERQLREVDSHDIVGSDGKDAKVIRLPYSVRKTSLSGLVDLREPATRQWLFTQFSKPNDDWIWPESLPGDVPFPDSPRTILSRFEWKEERAPVPTSFFEMLPTLLNPLRGGGDQTWGGATLMAVGDWLRNHDVQALIYPSARSDFRVAFENGKMQDFEGWCLVDYRRAHDEDPTHIVVFDSSPWSWAGWPPHVELRAGAEDSAYAGSLLMDGVVNQNALEYVEQNRCIQAAASNLGGHTVITAPRGAFALGAFTFRWLHAALLRSSQETILDGFRTCCGLVLQLDKEHLYARLRHVHSTLASTGELAPAIQSVLEIANELQQTVNEREEIQDIVGAGIDVELILLILSRLTLSGGTTLKAPLSAPSLRKLAVPDHVKNRIHRFLALVETPGSPLAECSVATVEIAEALTAHFGEQNQAPQR